MIDRPKTRTRNAFLSSVRSKKNYFSFCWYMEPGGELPLVSGSLDKRPLLFECCGTGLSIVFSWDERSFVAYRVIWRRRPSHSFFDASNSRCKRLTSIHFSCRSCCNLLNSSVCFVLSFSISFCTSSNCFLDKDENESFRSKKPKCSLFQVQLLLKNSDAFGVRSSFAQFGIGLS